MEETFATASAHRDVTAVTQQMGTRPLCLGNLLWLRVKLSVMCERLVQPLLETSESQDSPWTSQLCQGAAAL